MNFDKKLQDKWFNIDNYVKYLCDRERSLIKKYVKSYTIAEFFQNYSSIVHNIAVDNMEKTTDQGDTDRPWGRYFEENGIKDMVRNSVPEDKLRAILENKQRTMAEMSQEKRREQFQEQNADKALRTAELMRRMNQNS